MLTPADPSAASPLVRRPRGRPRKTEAERDGGNRRQTLLKGAARLFKRKGFGAATTRDIASAAGMRSGSPFYHFESKQALLFAVMHEGMLGALQRQRDALVSAHGRDAATQLGVLVRSHFDVLLGAGSDFIPVMLYEARSLAPRQRTALARLQQEYEAAWVPVLHELHAQGRLRADPKLSRLLIFGALNWSVQWFDRRQSASVEALGDAALALFIGNKETT